MMTQPPSGGCVLKQSDIIAMNINDDPAAFGRLCVETTYNLPDARGEFPAAFGRLCVETKRTHGLLLSPCSQPPSGGCVLKPYP